MKNKLSINYLNVIVVLFAIIFCQLCPNDVSGFFGAKMYQGRIRNDTYYAQDGSFEVKLPHNTSSNEFRHMSINEAYHPDKTLVAFVPAAKDDSAYGINGMQQSHL